MELTRLFNFELRNMEVARRTGNAAFLECSRRAAERYEIKLGLAARTGLDMEMAA